MKTPLQNRLPQHSPPDWLWDNIDNQLADNATPVAKPFGAIQILRYAAAAVLVLGVSVWGFYDWHNNSEQITYSQERLEQKNEPSQTDKSYEDIVAYCQNRAAVCENPKIKTLRTELDQLTEASKRLQTAMGNFNPEPQLLEQLSVIEKERNLLIAQLKPLLVQNI